MSERTMWDIGKALNGMFQPGATDTPTEEQEQDIDADATPDEGMVAEDDEVVVEASEDEDADPESEETSAPEPFLTLRVDGKDITIGSKEEAIPLAQKGMHYTQEMQRLREEQRQWEEARERESIGIRQQREQYVTALQTLSSVYGHVLGSEPPNWASDEMATLKRERPDEYVALREQWDQLGAIRSEIARHQREEQEKQQKQFAGWVQQQQSALADKRPEWSDPTRRQQDYTLIRDYALGQGVTEQEIGALFDHRFWLILHDAARYRKAESAGKSTRPQASKTAEPGSGKGVNAGNRKYSDTRNALKKTGDPRAAGAIFQDMMTKRR